MPPAVAAEENPLNNSISFVRRHLWTILAAGLVGLGVAFYIVATTPKVYRAQAVVQIVDNRQAMVGNSQGAAMRLAGGADEVMTQVQILKSRSVLGVVVDTVGLRLQFDPEMLPAGTLRHVSVLATAPSGARSLYFTSSTVEARGPNQRVVARYGQPLEVDGVRLTVDRKPAVDSVPLWVSSRSSAITSLNRDLRAWPRERTNVVDLEYAANDPAVAQSVVNTAAETFQTLSKGSSKQEAQRRREFLEVQLQRTEAQFREAQVALSDFRTARGVYSSKAQLEAEQAGMIGIDVQRAELSADRDMYRRLLARASGPSGDPSALRALLATPAVSANPVVAAAVAKLSDLETVRDSLTAGPYGKVATNPEVQKVDQMLASRRAELRDAVRSQLSALDAKIAALDNLHASNMEEIRSQPPMEAEEVRLVQRVETLGNVSETLMEDLQGARMAEAVESGKVEILDAAPLPEQPLAEGRIRKLVFGLLLGLMAGGGIAYLRENTNTSVRSREDIEGFLRVPILAVVPQFGAGATVGRRRLPALLRSGKKVTGTPARGLVAVDDTRSPGAEAFRTLRTNLIFSQSVDSLKSLVVTSSAPGEGKTTVAANMAIALAQQGIKVVLLDCDLRKPRAHEVFRVPREPGLTNVVAGRETLEAVTRPTEVENLSFVAAGVLPPNPSELLGSPRFRALLAQLDEKFDLVVLDTPPLLAAADAAILGREADGVVLVVRAGQADRGAVIQATQQLAKVGAHLIGAVLNDPEGAAAKAGGYYHYEYYGTKT
jgi:capsular exopolysaccharide synthesis family protein